MLYSLTNSLADNAAIKSTQPTAKYRAIDNDKLINFKETNLLVAEYSNTTKDNKDRLKTVTEDKGRRELKLRVIAD